MMARLLRLIGIYPRDVGRSVCQQCGCEIVRPDGCCCYYVALRQDAEQKDMIARLAKWQKGAA